MQLMQQYVQKSSSTNRPRRSASDSGAAILTHSPPSKPGAGTRRRYGLSAANPPHWHSSPGLIPAGRQPPAWCNLALPKNSRARGSRTPAATKFRLRPRQTGSRTDFAESPFVTLCFERNGCNDRVDDPRPSAFHGMTNFDTILPCKNAGPTAINSRPAAIAFYQLSVSHRTGNVRQPGPRIPALPTAIFATCARNRLYSGSIIKPMGLCKSRSSGRHNRPSIHESGLPA